MDENNDYIYLSGSILLKVLENKELNKKVFIFFDDHSNKKYCNNDKNLFIDEFLENIYHENNVFLFEEPFNNDENIEFIWEDVPHVIKSRALYHKFIKKCKIDNECFIYPVDIRLVLIDISLDELIKNLDDPSYFNDLNLTVKSYLNNILYLFDLSDTSNNKSIIIIKKIFEKYKNNIYYKYLKKQFLYFYNKFLVNNLEKKIEIFLKENNDFDNFQFCKGYPFINNNLNNFEDQYDKLINGIMEFYIIILILGLDKPNFILYTGFYHAKTIYVILKKIYNLKKIYSNNNNNNNCLKINKKNIKNLIY